MARARVRSTEGKFLAEGRRVVMEALTSPMTIDRIFVRDDPALDDLRRAAVARDVEVIDAPDSVLKAVSATTTPQGCVAVMEMPTTTIEMLPSRIELGLVLSGVSDPGNAGTLIRSAAGAGCDAIVVTGSSVDPFNPKTVRASAGTIFKSVLVTGVSLTEAANAMRARGCTTIGADTRAAETCYEVDLTHDVCFVLGNEAHGLSDGEASIDVYARLPMPGEIESLNVAVAGSLMLFEAVRQRSAASVGLSSAPDD